MMTMTKLLTLAFLAVSATATKIDDVLTSNDDNYVIDELRRYDAEQQAEIEQLLSTIDEQELTLDGLISKTQELEQTRLKRRRNRVEDGVGFTAFLDSIQYFENGNRITFPLTISNLGDGYDTANSQFVCPRSGNYFFWFNVYSDLFQDFCDVTLFQNGNHIITGHEEVGGLYTQHAMVRASVLYNCAAGEVIYVQSESDECHIYGTVDGKWSVFGGFLVEEL